MNPDLARFFLLAAFQNGGTWWAASVLGMLRWT